MSSSGSSSNNLVQLAWGRYLQNLKTRPLKTKALTSACIASLSDVLAQKILTGKYTNPRRTFAMACFGLFWSGPSAHYWQGLLERVFQGKSDVRTVLAKVLIDQSTYGPLCNLVFMSFATLVLEGRTFAALRAKLVADYAKVQISGWKLWPLAALINYKLVPLHLRVLFMNFTALGWAIYLLTSQKAKLQ